MLDSCRLALRSSHLTKCSNTCIVAASINCDVIETQLLIYRRYFGYSPSERNPVRTKAHQNEIPIERIPTRTKIPSERTPIRTKDEKYSFS